MSGVLFKIKDEFDLVVWYGRWADAAEDVLRAWWTATLTEYPTRG